MIKNKFLTSPFFLCGVLLTATAFAGSSDHTKFSAEYKSVSVGNLNVAQPGRFTAFKSSSKLKWSSTLRTTGFLSLIHSNGSKLDELSQQLFDISQDPSKSLEEKNESITQLSKEIMLPALSAMGFPIRSVKLEPTRALNPTAKSAELKLNPQAYITVPSFFLEDTSDFVSRMDGEFRELLEAGHGIATTQEVELGTDGANLSYDSIFDSLLANHPSYEAVKPHGIVLGKANSCAVTFYDKSKYDLYPNERTDQIRIIFQNLFNLHDELKLNVISLKESSGAVSHVVNIHAGYGESNSSEKIYPLLRKILDQTPGLIVAGDLNLEKKNASWLENSFQDFIGTFGMEISPEPEAIGNPTWDIIAISGATEEGDITRLISEAQNLNTELFSQRK